MTLQLNGLNSRQRGPKKIPFFCLIGNQINSNWLQLIDKIPTNNPHCIASSINQQTTHINIHFIVLQPNIKQYNSHTNTKQKFPFFSFFPLYHSVCVSFLSAIFLWTQLRIERIPEPYALLLWPIVNFMS
jgi:hypothetical protein